MENLKLIRKIVKSFHHSTGKDVDELFQEAVFGYYKGLQSYEPEKGKITTHLWHCVSNHLKNYLKIEKDYELPLEPLESAFEKTTPMDEFFESMSNEAWQIANIILSDPINFVTLPPEQAKDKVINILLEKGMNLNKILSGIKYLEKACN